MSRIVGIDLGTTNSLVAYMDGDHPRVIADLDGQAKVPSIVGMTDNGLIVGESAKEHLVRDPSRTIYSVKRFMEKPWLMSPKNSNIFPIHFKKKME